MPPKSRRQLHSISAIQKCWSPESHSLSDDSVYSMGISSDDELKLNDLNLKDKIKISDSADIYEFCKTYCNTRYLSVLTYLTLRHFNITCKDTDAFLKNISCFSRKTAHSWSNTFLNESFDEFTSDNPCKKRAGAYKQVFWPLFIFTTKPNWFMHISTDYGFLITLMLNSMYFLEVLGVIRTH